MVQSCGFLSPQKSLSVLLWQSIRDICSVLDWKSRLLVLDLPLEESDIRTPDLFSSLHISNGDWVAFNDLSRDHCLEVPDGWKPHRVEKLSSSNGCKLISLGELGEVLLNRLNESKSLVLCARLPCKQSLLRLGESDGTLWCVNCECQFLG